MNTTEKLETYFSEEHVFKKELQELRKILVSTSLNETFKWRFPTYTLHNKNVISIAKFKNHYAIWFFNGVFLSDPYSLLTNAQEGKTKAMRHWKFTSKDTLQAAIIHEYCMEAIANEKKGLRLTPAKKNTSPFTIPKLLKAALVDTNTTEEFQKLSAYKQREFADYIALAKQEKTKRSRLEKIIPMIKKGIGLRDIYRK